MKVSARKELIVFMKKKSLQQGALVLAVLGLVGVNQYVEAAAPTFGTNTGRASIAIGIGSVTDEESSIAFGHMSRTKKNDNGINPIAIGTSATSDNGSISLGTSASSDVHSLALGENTVAKAKSVALGPKSTADDGSVSIGDEAKSEGSSIAIGSSAQALNGGSSVAIGEGAIAQGAYAVAIGASATSKARDGVALGNFSIASVEAQVAGYNVGTADNRTNTYQGLKDSVASSLLGAVSVGISEADGGNPQYTRQITNVAAGTLDSDAVNVAQLRNVNLKIEGDTTEAGSDVLLDSQALKVVGTNGVTTTASGQTISISLDQATQDKLNNLGDTSAINNAITELKDQDAAIKSELNSTVAELKGRDAALEAHTNEVGAQAAALAGLKAIQFDPKKRSQIMAGVGNYKDKTSVALGLAHYANEDTLLHVGTTVGNHRSMINGGITYKFGKASDRKDIAPKYRGGPISSIYVMQDDMKVLETKYAVQQNELAQLRSQNEAQASEIAELKSLVQSLVNKK